MNSIMKWLQLHNGMITTPEWNDYQLQETTNTYLDVYLYFSQCHIYSKYGSSKRFLGFSTVAAQF